MHYAVQAIAQIGGMQKVTRPMPTTDRVQRATVALQMAEFATNVGRRLKQLREERKARDPRWTQDYAARQIREDLTGAQYARWERGEVLPREETIERLAEVFDVPVASFYSGEPQGKTPDLMLAFTDGNNDDGTPEHSFRSEVLSSLSILREAEDSVPRAEAVDALHLKLDAILARLQKVEAGQSELRSGLSQVRTELAGQRKPQRRASRGSAASGS
jgi:transcriptional regulator with XRE-family HTH domain